MNSWQKNLICPLSGQSYYFINDPFLKFVKKTNRSLLIFISISKVINKFYKKKRVSQISLLVFNFVAATGFEPETLCTLFGVFKQPSQTLQNKP